MQRSVQWMMFFRHLVVPASCRIRFLVALYHQTLSKGRSGTEFPMKGFASKGLA